MSGEELQKMSMQEEMHILNAMIDSIKEFDLDMQEFGGDYCFTLPRQDKVRDWLRAMQLKCDEVVTLYGTGRRKKEVSSDILFLKLAQFIYPPAKRDGGLVKLRIIDIQAITAFYLMFGFLQENQFELFQIEYDKVIQYATERSQSALAVLLFCKL